MYEGEIKEIYCFKNAGRCVSFIGKEKYYYRTILNIEIRIDNASKVYFNFLFSTIQAMAIKQSEIVTKYIIYQ